MKSKVLMAVIILWCASCIVMGFNPNMLYVAAFLMLLSGVVILLSRT